MNESMYLPSTMVMFQPANVSLLERIWKRLWSLALWYDLPFQLANISGSNLCLFRPWLGGHDYWRVPKPSGTPIETAGFPWPCVPRSFSHTCSTSHLHLKIPETLGRMVGWSSHRRTKYTPWTNKAPVYVKAFPKGRLHLNATPVFQVQAVSLFQGGQFIRKRVSLKGSMVWKQAQLSQWLNNLPYWKVASHCSCPKRRSNSMVHLQMFQEYQRML